MKGGARLLGDVQEAQRQLRGGPVQRAVPVDRGLPHLQAREQDLRPVLLRERAPRQGVGHGIHPRSHGKQGATCPKSEGRSKGFCFIVVSYFNSVRFFHFLVGISWAFLFFPPAI